MLALDVTRLEAGLILLEVDYTSARHAMNPEQNYSPFEIGLGRLVSFDKADYVGRRALKAEQAAGGPPRRLVGPAARLVRHRAAVRRAGPAAGDLADHRPIARPRVRRGRAAGRQGHLARLEPDPQAGDRARVGRRRASSGSAPACRSSGRSRAAAAGSTPRSSSCRSSTSSASGRDRRAGHARTLGRLRAPSTAWSRSASSAGSPELVEYLAIPSEGGDDAGLRAAADWTADRLRRLGRDGRGARGRRRCRRSSSARSATGRGR